MMPKFIWPGNQENQETRVFFLEKPFLFVDDDRVKYDENSEGAEM